MSMSKPLTVLFVSTAFIAFSNSAEAGQHTVVGSDGKTRIVHDELGPVLMHRVFPPYKGIHIHSSEMHRRNSTGRKR